MKIIGICASPRQKGNTYRLLNHFLKCCAQFGATTELLSTCDHRVEYCTACEQCMRSGTCPIEDDYLSLLPKILEADALVLATPNYAFDMSAQLKAVIDRSHAFLYYGQALKGKYGIGICVGGHPAMTHSIAKRLGQAVWLCGGYYLGAVSGISKHRDKKGFEKEHQLFNRANKIALKLIRAIKKRKRNFIQSWIREKFLVTRLKEMLKRRYKEYNYSAKQLLEK